jgi:hypothetical protein
MTNPLIQVDGEKREMTDAEYAQHQAIMAEMALSTLGTDETPSPA